MTHTQNESLFYESPEIRTRRVLKDAKIECRYRGQKMIKNVCLYGLVSCPDLIVAEDIDFQRQAVVSGRQLPDQKGHLLMDLGMVMKIGLHIGTKGPDVGQLSSVHNAGLVHIMFLVVLC